MNCKVCNKESQQNDLCQHHFKAYQNIIDGYDAWKKGSEVSWNQYLHEIQKNSLTGSWAKDVATYLIAEEKRKCQKK